MFVCIGVVHVQTHFVVERCFKHVAITVIVDCVPTCRSVVCTAGDGPCE